jgi:phosphatidylserine/phosphatidylglycerophosphate/cardiolipin synthase-like enzyme
MAVVSRQKGALTVNAFVGDAKTLLAFNLPKAKTKNLAGFTIQCQPGKQAAYFIQNTLRFENPAKHAQDASEPPTSSINAPIHKFRWVHIPGSLHQGLKPFLGQYTYTVTPRYFDASGSLLPMDPSLSAAVLVDVLPFKKGNLELGFTRGYTQSQAFVHHFGLKAAIQPRGRSLLFDTSTESGSNAAGQKFTFADEYEWLGFTAREQIFNLLDAVLANTTLSLDMFAYDLNEPDILKRLLDLAKQGRLRLILDNAALHHNAAGSKPEDRFEKLFTNAAEKVAGIKRGKFGRFAHDKVLIVKDASGPSKVLTGSTNFSVTGMYVNSNHVLVYSDPAIAALYADVFESAWNTNVGKSAAQKSAGDTKVWSAGGSATPKTEFSFAPHSASLATNILNGVADEVAHEGNSGQEPRSVMFAVMDLESGSGPVLPALKALHKNEAVFSYGISDSPGGIVLFSPGKKTGVLVTGKPTNTMLPPPFDQVPNISLGHQIHHKFVVCGFNRPDAVVYCGSSNLAAGGEENNGDNLLAIHDSDVATAFAIEAVTLVDHFEFLDRFAHAPKNKAKGNGKTKPKAPAAKQAAAAQAGWFISTNDKWTLPYYDPNDLHSKDRELFGGE